MNIWTITGCRWNFWPVKTILWVFLPLCCEGLPKWMKGNISMVCWLLTTVKSWLQGWKQEVSWTSWKLVKIILILPHETGHNLCLNLCFDQFLTIAIQETKVESLPKGTKGFNFIDSHSDKKALQSTFVIWFVLVWMSKILFQIGTIIPMVLQTLFIQLKFTPCFCHVYFVPSTNVNVALFSAYKTHTTHTSSNYIMVSLLVCFLSTHSQDKNLLVPCSMIYFSQLINRNCMHSLTMRHPYFLHAPTIFNQFWNSLIPIKV